MEVKIKYKGCVIAVFENCNNVLVNTYHCRFYTNMNTKSGLSSIELEALGIIARENQDDGIEYIEIPLTEVTGIHICQKG